jgi:hypothetical protein
MAVADLWKLPADFDEIRTSYSVLSKGKYIETKDKSLA